MSSGYQVSHVLPVVDGKLDARSCKRFEEKIVYLFEKEHGSLNKITIYEFHTIAQKLCF